MSTRKTLLATIQTFDTPTLEKLVAFQDKVLIPDADSLLKVTFADMVQKAHDLADTYFPTWTDRGKSDFGEFLVELMALFSYKDFWYINAYSLEAFLPSAKSYSNVCLHAMRLGYTPIGITSAGFNATLTFSNVPSPFSILPGEIEVSYGNTDLVFSNTGVINVLAGSSVVMNNIPFKSGKLTSSNVRFNGRSIRIPAVNVDATSVTVAVEGTTWTQVTSFADSDANSLHFMVYPSQGKELEIVFGQFDYGKRPQLDDTCNVQYRTDRSSGDSNKSIGTLRVTRNTANNYLTTAVMSNAATGGAFAESMESIRQNASLLFRTYNTTAIRGSEDCIRILEAMSDIFKANAFVLSNMLYFTVIPANGVAADNTLMADLEDRIKDDVMMGFTLSPSLTSYITISELTLNAYIYNEFDEADVVQQIRDYLTFITDPLAGAGYGVGFDTGRVAEELISNISGLNNVVFTTVNGAPAANIELSQLQIFNTINQGNVTINPIRVS